MKLVKTLWGTIRASICALSLALAGIHALVQGWPQWRGPHRDFKIESTGLKNRWAEGGPQRLWSRPLWQGHSDVIVDGGLIVHSQIEILTGRSWTVATLSGRILYLRDRKNILALQL
jgi:hypothetical protein